MMKRHHDTGKEDSSALADIIKMLSYEDGVVIRKHSVLKSAIGTRAGYEAKDGYRRIGVGQKKFLEHRVVWALVNGEWPPAELDHINGCKADNKIENLRLATRRLNVLNTGIRRTNASGEKNIYWSKPHKAWRVTFRINKVRHDLGCFKNKQDAILARNTFMQDNSYAF